MLVRGRKVQCCKLVILGIHSVHCSLPVFLMEHQKCHQLTFNGTPGICILLFHPPHLHVCVCITLMYFLSPFFAMNYTDGLYPQLLFFLFYASLHLHTKKVPSLCLCAKKIKNHITRGLKWGWAKDHNDPIIFRSLPSLFHSFYSKHSFRSDFLNICSESLHYASLFFLFHLLLI